MTYHRLEPWMLSADWRHDDRPFVVIDLTTWPRAVPLDPLPPIPVIAVGSPLHPLAEQADIRVDTALNLVGLASAITKAPRAAWVIVDLLRATEGMETLRALTCESLAFAALQSGREHRNWLAAHSARTPTGQGGVVTERDGDVVSITVDRPTARNAIDRALRDALFDACSLANLDADIQTVRITATGRCFGVGADLSEFGTTDDPPSAHFIRSRTLPARAILPRASIYEVHVRGACIGASLEFAAFAGRVTASSDAWFQLPELGMGILPGAGGCVSVPRRIGRQRAALMMLSGRRIDAQTALDWGLIDAIVDDPALDHRGPDIGG
ncbi:Fatty acid oxidation complex subunit alpha [Brevundimonas sp. NIBR10]|uniref:enoyl-CoA hydratase/isomerase family protein n=1 Tax=Brevundimonas sp. NIBR10 TaxID=3015997 RepID=UPI0022F16FC1|nr:enoyl-CoA hydratase/isomerase family protein [Brevundimonas sp. NIBR10]WGM47505.1 Fatty acid oxidation complex subunit alpha [Brevundimonas sp. NIBR10]